MKQMYTQPAANTTADSIMSYSDHLSEPAECSFLDPRISASFDSLEKAVYRKFSTIEMKLDETERMVLSAIRKHFDDFRVANIESMEAAQLDLECLRNQVKLGTGSVTRANVTNFLNETDTATIAAIESSLNRAVVTQFIDEHFVVTYKLPTACMNIVTTDVNGSHEEILKFDMTEREETEAREVDDTEMGVDESVPFSEALLGKDDPLLDSDGSSPNNDYQVKPTWTSRPTPVPTRHNSTVTRVIPHSGFGTPSRVVLSSFCALTVGAAVHLILGRLTAR